MQEAEVASIEMAVAYLIKKLADFLWIIPLALIPAIFLTVAGYSSFVQVLDIFRKIVVNTLWFFFFWKVAEITNNQMNANRAKS